MAASIIASSTRTSGSLGKSRTLAAARSGARGVASLPVALTRVLRTARRFRAGAERPVPDERPGRLPAGVGGTGHEHRDAGDHAHHTLLECSGPLKPMPGKRRVRIDSSARISSRVLLGNLVRRFSRSSQLPTSSESLMVNGLDLGIAVTSVSCYTFQGDTENTLSSGSGCDDQRGFCGVRGV